MGMLTKEQRSYCMSRIASKNTKPEIIFRKYLWNVGVRGYRLHNKLPGKPDLYFGHRKTAVFIDGCFWHMCSTCFVKPKSNNEYWDKKLSRNVQRDKEVNKLLGEMNITVLRLWEHDIKKDLDGAYLKLINALQLQ